MPAARADAMVIEAFERPSSTISPESGVVSP